MYNELFYENDLVTKTKPEIKDTMLGHEVFRYIFLFIYFYLYIFKLNFFKLNFFKFNFLN